MKIQLRLFERFSTTVMRLLVPIFLFRKLFFGNLIGKDHKTVDLQITLFPN